MKPKIEKKTQKNFNENEPKRKQKKTHNSKIRVK